MTCEHGFIGPCAECDGGGQMPDRQEFWQTKARGTNDQEYQIYVDCARDLGWRIKSYDEWLNS